MGANFKKLQQFPAYGNVLVTESELLSTLISDETWGLTEAYYRRLALLQPEARIVSFAGGNLSFIGAAQEVANKSERGMEIVKAYKGLLERVKGIVMEEADAE